MNLSQNLQMVAGQVYSASLVVEALAVVPGTLGLEWWRAPIESLGLFLVPLDLLAQRLGAVPSSSAVVEALLAPPCLWPLH